MAYYASGCSHKSFDVAVAIELIHTYSLIHDDLPAMDNDDLRRGIKSLHKHTSEASAILTGDLLLTHAFEVIATSTMIKEYEKIPIITILSQASGGNGLIEGQVLDLFSEQKCHNDLLSLYEKKTSKLFIAALLSGEILSNTTTVCKKKMRLLGLHFGIAFQLLDDIQDESKNIQCFSKNEIDHLFKKQKSLVFQILDEIQNQELYALCLKVLQSKRNDP